MLVATGSWQQPTNSTLHTCIQVDKIVREKTWSLCTRAQQLLLSLSSLIGDRQNDEAWVFLVRDLHHNLLTPQTRVASILLVTGLPCQLAARAEHAIGIRHSSIPATRPFLSPAALPPTSLRPRTFLPLPSVRHSAEEENMFLQF